MERTLLAFLFYFQSFRNGRLFSYPKSKGERENMNKLVKRLLTGTLAFATILTALPVTAVHASGNQYWTESAERVGYIEICLRRKKKQRKHLRIRRCVP